MRFSYVVIVEPFIRVSGFDVRPVLVAPGFFIVLFPSSVYNIAIAILLVKKKVAFCYNNCYIYFNNERGGHEGPGNKGFTAKIGAYPRAVGTRDRRCFFYGEQMGEWAQPAERHILEGFASVK